jgi:hypothetical protein
MKDNGTKYKRAQGLHITHTVDLRHQVEDVVSTTPVIDVHTHLYSSEFGGLNLFGIDELLTYHYLVAEMFRSSRVFPETFWRMTKTEQADLVWKTIFVENTPLSEAARGIITILNAFGLDPTTSSLAEARAFFRSRDVAEHLDKVLDIACVESVVMTNDPFDACEMQVWEQDPAIDRRFFAALRMDRLLNHWSHTAEKLARAGFAVEREIGCATIAEIRRYLDICIERMNPLYMAVSLPDDFSYPVDDARSRLINEVVLPTARVHNLPFALMVGVRRGVNPALKVAGDGVGRADVKALERICVENPDVRFLATFLSRENQHELCVAARKFNNLMPFGCWWFLNNPSIIAEITSERLELLGTSFIPQHSDARVLEQLIYKWRHSRALISDCLYNSYAQLLSAGRPVSRTEIERDVNRMFSGNFREWMGLAAPNSNGIDDLDLDNRGDVSAFHISDSPAQRVD